MQEALFAAARALLTEHGVAFVSYLALPGAAAGQALSEHLRSRVGDEPEPALRVERARQLAAQLAMDLPPGAPHAAATRKLVGRLGGMPDSHVLHDYLTSTRTPLSLTSFVARARVHGLQYLGDAQLHAMLGAELDDDALDEARRGAADQVAFEQRLDVVLQRPFRTSLLCRAERVLDRSLSWQRLDGLFLSTRCRRVAGEERWTFQSPAGDWFNAGSALVGEALERLVDAWPAQVEFSALTASASGEDRATLGANLVAALGAGQLDAGTTDRGIARAPSAAPLAFSVAREQAASGSLWATNLWHERVELEPALRRLLPLLDGTRTAAQLEACLPGVGAPALRSQLAALAAEAFLVQPLP